MRSIDLSLLCIAIIYYNLHKLFLLKNLTCIIAIKVTFPKELDISLLKIFLSILLLFKSLFVLSLNFLNPYWIKIC